MTQGVGGSQGPQNTGIPAGANPIPKPPRAGVMKNSSVTSNEVDKTLLLKEQKTDASPQKETPLSERNIGNPNTADQDSSIPAPPPPPPLKSAEPAQVATPAPESDKTATSENNPAAQKEAEASDSATENASTEIDRQPRKRSAIAEKFAHLFGKLKRFVTGTNFEKLPPALLNDIKNEAVLVDNVKTAATEEPNLLANLHQQLTEWNNKVDQLAQLKEGEGAASPKRTELKNKMKALKQQITDLVNDAEKLLEVKEVEKRLKRNLTTKTQQIDKPEQEEVIKQMNEAATVSSSEELKPSSLTEELRAVKLKKTSLPPEQKSPEQTTASSDGMVISPELLTSARKNLKRKADDSQANQVTPESAGEPEFMRKLREIKNGKTGHEE
ncbi:hypothetical protein [Endozoicomonas euniceicola]|uniref:WH2 domain-containing protein n=1 Tax=Endozoicomonas euniceicola TaxID=1234143 RepID=A0ABY6GRJ8_9GAMM|nr:hypothetical protein [Endozoicomonas euniceicola]UYM15374.1 hypothetical protein NX720_21355 [Endozoicomonas euniceicola]